MTKAISAAAIFVALALGGVDCAAQSDANAVMNLNRTGKWTEAAALAKRMLSELPDSARGSRCELYSHLAYASARTTNSSELATAIARFDRECSDLPPDNWVVREIAPFRAAAASATSPTAAPGTSATSTDAFWQTADPLEMGLDGSALSAHAALCQRTGADSCLVVYKGKIVQEWYGPTYHEPVYAMSTTKSIAGVLAVLLMEDGKLGPPTTPVCRYLSEWCSGLRAQVTLEHLLTMTSGLPQLTDGRSVGFESDKNAFVRALSPTSTPGQSWAYSNEGAQLLSPILDAAAGEPIQDYAQKRLFEPLGMTRTRMHLDSKGHAWTYADAETTPRDLARLGLLMLEGGRWGDRQILSAAGLEYLTSPSQSMNAGYGRLWWLHVDPNGFAGHGHLDTHLHVFPELGLVLVRTQANPLPGVMEGTYDAELLPIVRRMVKPE